jgi:uncharacterized protein
MKVNIISLKKMTASSKLFSFTTHTEDFFPEYKNEENSFFRDGEIIVEGDVTSKGELMEVEGTIRASLKCLCNVCLEENLVKLNIPFHQKYQETEKTDKTFGEPDEDDLRFYTGEEIDIKPLIRETLILAQPLRQVCKEECKGLCPDCGTNLNMAACGCKDKKIDPRMALLEELIKKRP